jgi:high-affinity iron transporter
VWLALLAAVAGLVPHGDRTGPIDPTEVHDMSRGTVVFNSAMIVFRKGLEAVLIFAAVIASFQGANCAWRRPVKLGALVSFCAAIATWFAVRRAARCRLAAGPPAGGDHRVCRDRRAARRPQLVRAHGVLGGLDRQAPCGDVRS